MYPDPTVRRSYWLSSPAWGGIVSGFRLQRQLRPHYGPLKDFLSVGRCLSRFECRDGVPVRWLHSIGLGLATCSRIAAAHGGRLEISGNPGEGTTVSLFLPADG
ncbi:sensor histidine kinase [Pseudarthrobacter sp. NPDC080039]|uniref:sensor histidine kinase n=1 Tax=unclassified Pseudarthrobacter TaxID=2647000 RepID=UPI00344FA3CB